MSDPAFGNVAAWLPEMARRQPDSLAVAVASGRGPDGRSRFETLTASQLDARCDRIAHGLESVGIRRGVRTVLMVTPSPQFFALTFALFKVEAVPVLVDPGMGTKNLKQCLGESEPEAFVGISKAHAARILLGWPSGDVRVTVGRRWFWGGPTLSALEQAAPSDPYPVRPPHPDQVAAILFTSGSTGVPKGAVYTHRNFAAQLEIVRDIYGIEPGERDLSTFPLFALFGPGLGMAAVVPEMDASRPAEADPERLVDAIDRFECTNLFASPALIDKLGRHCEQTGRGLPTLRRAISAGAPARIPAVERFTKALDGGAQLLTPYGATEALPVSLVGSDTLLGEARAQTEQGGGVCVGTPVDGVEVAVIGITDEPIERWSPDLLVPVGQVGEIVVKGDNVTERYWNRPESTALAKITDGDGPVRHRMGDVGYLDDTGRLWMCGRKAHRVEAAGGCMFTVPCEAVFDTHPEVFRSALVGVRRPTREAPVPVLCVELEPGVSQARRLALTSELLDLAKRYEHTKAIEAVVFHPSFPVDVRHNAKIFREELARWAHDRVAVS